MIIRLIKKTKIFNFTLPKEVAGNYWIKDTDYFGNERNLINVEAEDGNWKIKSDFETKIMNGDQEVMSAFLQEYNLYFLKVNTDNEYVILYCSPTIESNIIKLNLKSEGEITIGNDPTADINYAYPLVSNNHAKLTYSGGKWSIEDRSSKYGTYVNNSLVSEQSIEYGDNIFIMGLKIIVIGPMVILNKIGDYISYNHEKFDDVLPIVQIQKEFDNPDEEAIEFYKEEDYFYRAPRFKTKIEPVNISIEAPPAASGNEDNVPIIYTLGPMLTMGFTSMSTGLNATIDVINGMKDFSEVSGQIMAATAMLGTVVLWPALNKSYQKRARKKRMKLRKEKYTEYIAEKKKIIENAMKVQRQILVDNYLPLSDTKAIIYNKKRNLWEREIEQEDFLDLRLGMGSTGLKGTINYPQEGFSIDTDELLKEVYKIGDSSKILENVPISLSFIEKNISAIIGTASIKRKFIEGLLLQMITYHSYEDLKIVIFTDDKNSSNWDCLKIVPHCWSNDRQIRYFATNLDEAKEISLVLEKDFQSRKFFETPGGLEINTEADYRYYKPYYVVITDNYKDYREVEFIKDIAESRVNYGYSLIVESPRLVNIPNECKTFISIGDKKSGIFENELVSNKQKEFIADYDATLDLQDCCKILANIPIDIQREDQSLPKGISFLEMYNVGMVEQLNILSRWKNNDPTKSLQAPVGVDKSRELFKLDLHEKFHGPHGLIAGMTGSGKSEFIITYIVSMALNYHPYEVSFVLIDYKGGGLAGVFQNKETGMKLPHLAGTITNLDTNEMNRSLASIQSELRKRQRMFNEARDNLNESTIDIYKYQDLYRKGKVEKPISHLFIISDEFAELKAQRPEFMEQLIQIARIGRSLGVHLILATQKPAGVVDDQIWSNSKFRVCLKVQDKADSMDMIRCPDAASLKNAGRFYLQVGYNELFALGQAAWAGAQYYPTEKRKKKVDQSISIIDNVGNTIKVLDTDMNQDKQVSQGEEITNIIKYIVDEANKSNISIEQLWLDKIPSVIYIDDLRSKYNYVVERNNINPIIGEYDDPNNQKQGLLTLPLSKMGNTIIYGIGGSGKEMMVTSMIYSIITTHDPTEVNLYLLDFGAETLKIFKNAPHVGDVLLATENEKIDNLFKLLNDIIEERKKLFTDYNGSYDFYINHGGKQLPLIIITIVNIEAFLESFEAYDDIITQMTRDCLKYGIIFVLTTSGANTVRYRLKQNFSQNIVLQFNDPSDYGSIISGARYIEPSKIYGRGLVERESIFEYQTAYVYKEEKISDYIKIVSKKLNKMFTIKAQPIPILPEHVTQETVTHKLGNNRTIPIGVAKESLDVETLDLESEYIHLITGEDIGVYPNFIFGFTKNIVTVENTKCMILDANSLLEKFEINNKDITYDKNKCSQSIELIKSKFNEYQKNPTANEKLIVFLVGLSSLLSKLSEEEKATLINVIDKGMALDKFKFIIADNIDSIKNLNYEPWFKKYANLSEGIWIGNGLGNQFTLKVITNSRQLRSEIPDDFGYVIKKGKATLIKLMSDE